MKSSMDIQGSNGWIPGPVRPPMRFVYHTMNKLFARVPEFVIVGTGRSGTTFTAQYLSRIGIACSHEFYYTAHGPMLRNPDRFFLTKGDASWLAVPFVANASIPVLHQVRNPLDVIRSLLKIGFFDPAFRHRHGEFIAFAERHFQTSADPVETSIRWYLDWNRRCEDVSEFRFRVEDFDTALPEVLRRIGYPNHAARTELSTRTNARQTEFGPGSDQRFEQDIRNHPLFPELTAMAARYGYALDHPGIDAAS